MPECVAMCSTANRIPVKRTRVTGVHETRDVSSLPWNPHAKFPGVAMQHLVTGSETGGRMSIHHVRVGPGCAIGDHTHAGIVEIHDVLEGSGICTVDGKEIPYVPGVIGIMPVDTVHRIVAGDQGILLLATFSPPLV
ncbi:MAG: cupin domain-containing protein [Methanoregulaceae archaeon]